MTSLHMRLKSLNVGLPRSVEWKGRTVETGIFKEAVEGRLQLGKLNLDGDRQADLTVHGGVDKAVYVYPAEHYAFWQDVYPETNLPWGMFGENFTTEGLLEDEVHIGDRFRVGSALVEVSEPRVPCSKLGLRFGRDDVIKRFLQSRRTGFYFRVLEEGEVGSADEISLVPQGEQTLRIADVTELFVNKTADAAGLQRAVECSALSVSWRGYFEKRLEKHLAGGERGQ